MYVIPTDKDGNPNDASHLLYVSEVAGTALNTAVGAKDDAAAATDTGTFSVIAFIKRSLQNWTSLLAKIPGVGPAVKAAAVPVTMATDQPAITVDTELPAAILLADNMTIPTTPLIGAVLAGYDGTNIDLLRIDANKNLVVTLAAGANKVDIGGQAASDTNSTGLNTLVAAAFNMGFDGTNWVRLRADSLKNLLVSTQYSYNHISTNTTTVVKASAGVLHSISVNTAGAGTTITVYDHASGVGTVIAVLDGSLPTLRLYDLSFGTGLTIITASGTPADITVTYR